MILRSISLVAVLSLAGFFGCATGEDTISAEAASTGSGGAGGGACAELLADCDGDPSNGCETDTRASSLHCGGCGNECKSVGGQASCADGACSIACELPFGDCDGDASNGCETNREISTSHCGACGYGCDVYPNPIVSCIKGTCIGLCSPGLGNCDGSLENGCETVLATNPSHCGACGKECAAGCAAGKCQGVVLATGQASPISITSDARHVYWTNAGTPPAYADGSVRKVSKAGGAPVQLTVDRKAFGIAVDATNIYWLTVGTAGMNDGTVRMLAK
jgi:hypothetical protein